MQQRQKKTTTTTRRFHSKNLSPKNQEVITINNTIVANVAMNEESFKKRKGPEITQTRLKQQQQQQQQQSSTTGRQK
jgi:hypothetical protein